MNPDGQNQRCLACLDQLAGGPASNGLECIHDSLACIKGEGLAHSDVQEGLLMAVDWLAGQLRGPLVACGMLPSYLKALRVVSASAAADFIILSNSIAALRVASARLVHIRPSSTREQAKVVLLMLGQAQAAFQRVITLDDLTRIGACSVATDSMMTKQNVGDALVLGLAPGDVVQISTEEVTQTLVALNEDNVTISLTDSDSAVQPNVLLTLFEACKAVPGICPTPLVAILTYTNNMAYLMQTLPAEMFAAAVSDFGMEVPNGFAVGLVSGQVGIRIPGLLATVHDLDLSMLPEDAWLRRALLQDSEAGVIGYAMPLPPNAVINMTFPLDRQMMAAALSAGGSYTPVLCSKVVYSPRLGIDIIGTAIVSEDWLSATCLSTRTGDFVLMMVSPVPEAAPEDAIFRYNPARWAAKEILPSDNQLRGGSIASLTGAAGAMTSLMNWFVLGAALTALVSACLWGCKGPSIPLNDDDNGTQDEEAPFLDPENYPSAYFYRSVVMKPSGCSDAERGIGSAKLCSWMPDTHLRAGSPQRRLAFAETSDAAKKTSLKWWDPTGAVPRELARPVTPAGIDFATGSPGLPGGSTEGSADDQWQPSTRMPSLQLGQTSGRRHTSNGLPDSFSRAAPVGRARGMALCFKAPSKADAHRKIDLQKTPLHLAAARGDLAKVRDLLDSAENRNKVSAASAISATDALQRSPLHIAASVGHAAIAKEMLSRVLLQHRRHLKAHFFRACLASRGSNRAPEVFDINMADVVGNTALHLAAANGHANVIGVLCEIAAVAGQPLDAARRNRAGWTPLQLAARHGQVNAVAQLLQIRLPDPGHNEDREDDEDQEDDSIPVVDLADDDGESRKSALHLASKYGHVQVVRLLLNYLATATHENALGGFPKLRHP